MSVQQLLLSYASPAAPSGFPVTDDFAGTGALSANWTGTAVFGAGFIVRDTGKAVEETAFRIGVAYWNAAVFTNDHYSQCVVSNLDSSDWCGPVVRCSGSDGYMPRCLSGATNMFIIKTDGSFIAGTGLAVANGDTVKIAVVGTTITVSVNGVAGVPATDSTYTTGAAGIYVSRGNGSANPQIDDWAAGSIP